MIKSQPQKFIKNAIFISYTGLKDFLNCPRSYYLKNIYRNPENGFKLQIASPNLALGSTVHDGIKWFLEEVEKPTEKELIDKYRNLWLRFRGKKGGFASLEDEANFGRRGLSILENFYKNWQILGKSAPRLTFPKYNLFEDVVLMGNFDYIKVKEDGTLFVIDFKSGANDEKDPLQLYIYAILAEANLERDVTSAGYWYLDRDDEPREIVLDLLGEKLERLTEKGKEIKDALTKNEWVCIRRDQGGCRDCNDYQALLNGKGEFQFSDYRYKKDVYYLKK